MRWNPAHESDSFSFARTTRRSKSEAIRRWSLQALCLLLALGLGTTLADADPTPYLSFNEGPRVHALVGARIVPTPGQLIEDGTIVLRDGVIEAVGRDVSVPPDARIWSMEGLTVYPGLIEPYLRASRLEKEAKKEPPHQGPPEEPPVPGRGHPHPRVHPETNVTTGRDFTAKDWEAFHQLGFTTAYLVPDDGIFRGRGTLLSLREGRATDVELRPSNGQCLAFDMGSGPDDYPRSMMGVVALMRQTLLDAQHHLDAANIYDSNPRGQERPEQNESLDALARTVQGLENVFLETDDVLATLRAGQVSREFGLRTVLRCSGEEYRYLQEVQDLGYPLIVPVAFPDAPWIEDELAAHDVSIESLRSWDRAPSNPASLARAGIKFALTTDRLRKPDFLPRMIRAAQSRGLDAETVLRAFTTEAARTHGVLDRVGTIEKGKIANLTVTDGELFALGTRVRTVWVDGHPQEVGMSEADRKKPQGLWRLESIAGADTGADTGAEASWLQIEGEGDSLMVSWSKDLGDAVQPRVAATFVDTVIAASDTLDIRWNENDAGLELLFLRDAYLDGRQGFFTVNGQVQRIRGVRLQGPPPPAKEQKKEKPLDPETPAAFTEGPIETPTEVLVQGATLWTCGPDGIIENADLLVRNGKIAAVGTGLSASSSAQVVDGAGLHVTPGLMDCHSHSMIVGGVNEWTLSSSAMVRIGDVVNSRTTHIYRQLAGGLTLANLLHGSANPIGGQNAVVKLRWGATPEQMKLQGAPPGIKFALGENVTQRSWGDAYKTRYPKSRMGVEQWMRERFLAAIDYAEEWKRYGALSRKIKAQTIPPRRDLELDALVEILNGERFIHCHSYRQDEILMLMRLAESFGFRIRTFQHILEGYKVADEMAEHGAMGSTFSDWWAYKPEVYDAIPHAAAIMHDRGVNVTMKSDSSELARRMNLEGTKAIKYGGVDPEEALKMVTLNVATQLGFDQRLGSLEVGKDADFAVWNGSPHSTGSICVQTWVDGHLYFDRDVDLERRDLLAEERKTLIAKARKTGVPSRDKAQGPPTASSYALSHTHQYTCGHDHGDEAGAGADVGLGGTIHSERYGYDFSGGRK